MDNSKRHNHQSKLNAMSEEVLSSLSVIKNKYHSDSISISLLLPTRDRVEHLNRFCHSLLENSFSIKNIEIILYIDSDDLASQQYVNDYLNITKLIGPKLTMGQYNSVCYQHSIGNIVMLVNDDLIVQTKDWDKLLFDRLAKVSSKVFLAYPNDGINKGNLCSFPIMTRETCETMVFPFPSIYKRLFIDTHVMDVFIRLNKIKEKSLIYLEEIEFTHLNLNPHVNNSSSTLRINDDDDIAFLSLRDLRSSQFKRLKSFINNEQLPEIETIYTDIDRNSGLFRLFKLFVLQFVFDKELPTYYRLKYLIKFTGHFFMIKTVIGEHFGKHC